MENNILGQSNPNSSPVSNGGNKLLQNVNILDKRELYRSYMPFIKTGGLYIPFNNDITSSKIAIDQNIFILLTLPDSSKKHPIPGKVVWIQRAGIHKGFGFAFGDGIPSKALKAQIENTILDLTLRKEPTYTF